MPLFSSEMDVRHPVTMESGEHVLCGSAAVSMAISKRNPVNAGMPCRDLRTWCLFTEALRRGPVNKTSPWRAAEVLPLFTGKTLPRPAHFTAPRLTGKTIPRPAHWKYFAEQTIPRPAHWKSFTAQSPLEKLYRAIYPGIEHLRAQRMAATRPIGAFLSFRESDLLYR